MTQPFETQQESPRNYDLPSIPPQYPIHTTPHLSLHQGSSNTDDITTLQVQPESHFLSTTLTRQLVIIYQKKLNWLQFKLLKRRIYNLI